MIRRLLGPLWVGLILAAAPLAVGETAPRAQEALSGPSPDGGREPRHPGDTPSAADGIGRILGDAGGRTAPDAEALAVLRARIDGIVGSSPWNRARIGVLAVDGETGDTLYARRAHEPLVPASNLKVLTTAAALHLLGPDFRWPTWVTTEAVVEDGVVRGDVILYGTGDPTIDPGTPRRPGAFDELARALAEAGIRRIDGRVLGDGTFFTGPDRVSDWDPRDLNDWFTAASPALSYNENVVQLRVEPTIDGLAPLVHTEPAHGGIAVDNQARTVSGRPAERLHMLRDDPTRPIRVVGEIVRGGRDVYRTMTVQDPVLFAAHGFDAALRGAGIEVAGVPGTIQDRSRSPLSAARIFTGSEHRILARHRSAPLIEALAVVNLESHNLYADLVLRTLGRLIEGDGSFEAGARVVEAFAVEMGAAPGSVRVLDGSGLAATNLTSPATLVTVLGHVLSSPYGEAFLQTLPEAGTRQLRRMVRTPAARNLRAKTGTIQGVSALSGLVRSADGRPILFSIVGNDLRSSWGAKRMEDDIGAALAGWSGSSP